MTVLPIYYKRRSYYLSVPERLRILLEIIDSEARVVTRACEVCGAGP